MCETTIRVTSAGGRIWLSGQVASEARRHAAEALAHEQFPGVEIRNELTVQVVGEPREERI